MKFKAVLIILTCYYVNVEMHKFGKSNFTSEWILSTKSSIYPPMVTKVQENLIFVSFPINYSIKLESSRITSKPCELPMPLIKNHEGNNVEPAYVEAMGNDNVLVAILESTSKNEEESHHTNVWLYVINPHKCSHDFTNFTLDAPLDAARHRMTIVPYKDSFDVFVKSKVYCSSDTICNLRYGNDLSMLNDFEKLLVPYEDEDWYLTTKRDFDPNSGYLYIIMNAKPRGPMLRYYDKLSLTREIRLNYNGSVSWWHEEADNMSTCFQLSNHEIEYILLDERLEVELSGSFHYDVYLLDCSTIRLPTGDALVLTILSHDPVGTEPATFVQLLSRASGQLSPPIKFQEFVRENVFEMFTFELSEGLFCVSIICQDGINTKCIAPEGQLQF